MSSDQTPALQAYAALQAYLRAGYSVIPVGPDKRPDPSILPGQRWSAYQSTRVSPIEGGRWIARGARNWAIVCGEVSGFLYGCDGDHEGFCEFILSPAGQAIIGPTWIVRTGCGLIHSYLKSRTRVLSGILKAGNLKVADIRGDGRDGSGPSYLVAPPTWIHCPKHGREGRYTTLSGSPEHVLLVDNALTVFQALADGYAAAQASRSIVLALPQPAAEFRHAPEIPAPLPPELKAALERKVRESRLSRKIQRALLRGCVAGVGDWVDARDSNSDVDYALCCALLRAKFSDDDILGCFTTLHAGDFTFKNPKRPQHGLRYFYDFTLKNARKAITDEQEAATKAKGDNFEVTDFMKIGFEDTPIFQVTVKELPGERVHRARLRSADFESDRAFNRAIWAQCMFMPELQSPAHTGAIGFQRFMKVLGAMAHADEDLPEEASEAGYTKSVLLSVIKSGAVQHGSDDPDANSLGWLNGHYVYLRSEQLTTRVKAVLRISAPLIWTAFTRLGGEGDTLEIGKRKERIWKIPKSSVNLDETS